MNKLFVENGHWAIAILRESFMLLPPYFQILFMLNYLSMSSNSIYGTVYTENVSRRKPQENGTEMVQLDH